MEYKQYEFRVNSSVSYDYYSDKPINYNIDEYVTLGFILKKPVLRNKETPKEMPSTLIANQHAITQVNPQVSPNSSEKKTFIYIKGKKVCVVPTKLNVVSVKFPLKPPVSKCQPASVNEEQSDQSKSPLPFSVLKPPTISAKCEKTSAKFEIIDNMNVKKEDDSRLCDSDTNSDSVSNFSLEDIDCPDILKSRNANQSIRTYSRCQIKKPDNVLGDVKPLRSKVIDYEKRVMTNIRTYRTRKSISTSCEDLYTTVAVSTQTIPIEDKTVKTATTVEACTQTDLDTNLNLNVNLPLNIDELVNSIFNSDNSNEPISFDLMGSPSAGPNPTRVTGNDKIMQQFYNDFKDCMNYNSKGNLPIHEGVLANDIKLVKRNCVVLQAKQEGVNILNHDNLSPLQLAILNETKEDIIELLLSYGADLGSMDTEGNNVLHLAIENGRQNALEIMMKYAKKTKFDIDTFNYEGLSPLMLCCINGSHDLAKLLLLNGAKPNLRDLKSGRTALFHASESHDLDMIKLLLKYKADTKIRNFFGTSPHDAMFEVDDIPECIKVLILGKDTHVRIQQKRRSSHSRSKFVCKKKPRYTSKTLNVVSTIQRIGTKVAIAKKPT